MTVNFVADALIDRLIHITQEENCMLINHLGKSDPELKKIQTEMKGYVDEARARLEGYILGLLNEE